MEASLKINSLLIGASDQVALPVTAETSERLSEIRQNYPVNEDLRLCLCARCSPYNLECIEEALVIPQHKWLSIRQVQRHFQDQLTLRHLQAATDLLLKSSQADGVRWLSPALHSRLVHICLVQGNDAAGASDTGDQQAATMQTALDQEQEEEPSDSISPAQSPGVGPEEVHPDQVTQTDPMDLPSEVYTSGGLVGRWSEWPAVLQTWPGSSDCCSLLHTVHINTGCYS